MGPLHVHSHRLDRREPGGGNVGLAGEVVDDVWAHLGDQGREPIGIEQVRPAVGSVGRHDLVAAVPEMVDQVPSDEPRGPGDERLHGWQRRSFGRTIAP